MIEYLIIKYINYNIKNGYKKNSLSSFFIKLLYNMI